MELVTEKYKQTDIGLIPSDWEVKSIKEVSKDMLQGVNTAIDIPVYVEDGIPMLKANNIIDGEVNFHTADHISFETFNRYTERFRIKKNDFLFSNIGARLGTGSLMKKDVVCSFAWNVMRIIPNTNVITPEYLSSVMNSPVIFKEIKKSESGSGMGFVPKNILQNISFPLPLNKVEQAAIATVLSDTDNYISSLEKLIAKKHLIKQGAMQQLLQPKKDWVVKKLGDFVKIRSGESPSKFVFTTTGIPYFKVEQLSNCDKYQIDTPYYIETENTIPKGSIIFPKRGASILLNKVRILKEDSFMDTNLMTLTLSNELDSEFIFYFLTYIELWRIADTTSIPQINNKHINPVEISFPSKSEQTNIANILSDMDSEIVSLGKQLTKAQAIKEGMMQQLLTGKIRLV